MGMDVNPGMLGGMLLGAAIASRQKSAAAPPMQAPEAPPQPAVRPDSMATLNAMKGDSLTQGVGQTWLTGPQGVDPKTVKTTKQSLYGN